MPDSSMTPEPLQPKRKTIDRWPAWPVGACTLVLAAATYVFGLGSLHIMANGDEMIYAHVVRMTAAAGHWLPLESDIPEMVNTKPPLIFWQGLLSTDWGREWTLWALRWPSLVWTALTAVLVGLLARRTCDGDSSAGMLAAAVYLAFLGTYRYGRPFLTNAPEIFWTFLCFYTLIMFRPWSFASRLAIPTLVGVFAGIALFAKSFAILVPIGLALAAWHLAEQGWSIRAFLVRSLPGLVWTAAVAMGIFLLWFVLDPEPEAIWRRFVLGENFAKLEHGAPSYIGALLWGPKSVWALFMGWFLDAGLLAFPLLGTMIRGWQHRREASHDEKLLWILCAATFLFYCIPTQRSGRYLLDAMPAVAVLMTIHWRKLLRTAFATTVIGSVALVLVVAWLSVWLLREQGDVEIRFPWWHWTILGAGVALASLALARPSMISDLAVPCVFMAYLAVASLLALFDPPVGAFDERTIAAARDRVVWAPEDFWASSERQRMLLPGATVRGYPIAEDGPAAGLRAAEDLLLVRRGIDEPAPDGAIGSRLELGSRHTASQLRDMLEGRVGRHLFRREWLVR